MSAMSLGELYVRLSLRNQQFATNLQAAAKKVDEFGKKVNEVGSKLGGLGVAGAAALGGFIRQAAEVNKSVATDMKGVEDSFRALSVEVATAAQPAIKGFADGIGKLAGFIRGLNPETKALAGNILAFGSGALIAVGGASKLVGAVTALAPLAGVVAPLIVPFLGIAAAIGGVVLLTGAMKTAWENDLGSMQTKAETTFQKIRNAATEMADTFDNAVYRAIGKLSYVLEDLANAWKGTPQDIGDGFDGPSKRQQRNPERRGKELLGNAEAAAKAAAKAAGDSLLETFKKGAETLTGPLKQVFEDLLGKFNAAPSVRTGTGGGDAAYGSERKESLRDELNPTLRSLHMQLKEHQWRAKDGLREVLKPKAMPRQTGTTMAELALKDLADTVERADKNLKALDQAAKARKTALKQGFLDQGMSMLPGNVGNVANGAAQGAANGGGIWGAVIGAVIELVGGSTQFQRAMEVLSDIFQDISDAFGKVLEPASTIMASLGLVIDALLGIMEPFLQFQAACDALIIPILTLIAAIIEGFKPLTDVIMKILVPVFKVVEFAFKALFTAVKYFGLYVLYVARAFAFFWDIFFGLVSGIMKALDKIPGVDLSKPIKAMEKMMIGDDIDKSIKKVKDMNWESAMAAGYKAEQDRKAGDAAQKLAQAMEANLPSWYKIEAARFATADFMTPGSGAFMGGGGSSGGGGGGTTINHNTTTIVLQNPPEDPKKTAALLKAEIERGQVAQTGSSAGGSRRPNKSSMR